MFGRIIQRDGAIEMLSRSIDIAGMQCGHADQAMTDCPGESGSLPFGERHELRCYILNRLTVEFDVVAAPNAPKEGKQQ